VAFGNITIIIYTYNWKEIVFTSVRPKNKTITVLRRMPFIVA
jgi:hypothetical protein